MTPSALVALAIDELLPSEQAELIAFAHLKAQTFVVAAPDTPRYVKAAELLAMAQSHVTVTL